MDDTPDNIEMIERLFVSLFLLDRLKSSLCNVLHRSDNNVSILDHIIFENQILILNCKFVLKGT